MFNVEDILARLQKGETIENVAAEMTKALNAAETQYNEEMKAAEAAKVQKEKEATLNDLAETILLAIGEYVSIKCPEVADAEDIDMEVAEFRELLDEFLDAMIRMKELFGEFALTAVRVPKTEPAAPKKRMTADDKIADFLKAMGL